MIFQIIQIKVDEDYFTDYFELYKPITCIIQRFGKHLNVVENYKWLGSGIELNATNYFTVTVINHGFYSLSCFEFEKKPDWYNLIYEDLFTILPKNMRQLVVEQAKYKKIIEDSKKNLTDLKFNPMLEDPVIQQCSPKQLGFNSSVLLFSILF